MMLRSRARYLDFISRRLPHAVILTAGLGVAGCGGRFLETPSALSRTLGGSAGQESAGRATLEDAPTESNTGVRTGARKFLASLFGRDNEENQPLRDPFLDTPVFAHAETADAAPGLARTADSSARPADAPAATASVTPSRTIVRPPRRPDASARPEIDEAAAQMAALAAQMERPPVANHDVPEWARDTATTGPAARLAQHDDTSPWTEQQTRAAAEEGRVRISRLQSNPASPENAPEPSRKIESLLAARRAREPHPEDARPAPTTVAPAPAAAVGERTVAQQRPMPPRTEWAEETVERPATDFAQRYAAGIAQREHNLPPWANPEPEQQPSRTSHPNVRDLPTHFENVLAVAETPARESDHQLAPDVETASAATAPVRWEPAVVSSTMLPLDDSIGAAVAVSDSTADDPFPLLNEWRGVGANRPVAITDRGEWNSRGEFDIHQTGFEEQVAAVIDTGFDVVGTAEVATVAPAPPVDANSAIRVIRAAPGEPGKAGSLLPWFVALLGAIGLGAFLYRRHLQRRSS